MVGARPGRSRLPAQLPLKQLFSEDLLVVLLVVGHDVLGAEAVEDGAPGGLLEGLVLLRVAEEVRRPERNLPVSILGGVAGVTVLFILANAAYLAILSPGEVAATGGSTATKAMERALGSPGRQAIALALMVSTIGAANGMSLTGARLAYATGRDQRLFRWLARTHTRTKAPVRKTALISKAIRHPIRTGPATP